MKIGYKIYKPCETQEELNNYAICAEWCNNNNCHIEDKGEYFEVVEHIPIPINATPSLEERISAMEEAMLEMMMGGAE